MTLLLNQNLAVCKAKQIWNFCLALSTAFRKPDEILRSVPFWQNIDKITTYFDNHKVLACGKKFGSEKSRDALFKFREGGANVDRSSPSSIHRCWISIK